MKASNTNRERSSREVSKIRERGAGLEPRREARLLIRASRRKRSKKSLIKEINSGRFFFIDLAGRKALRAPN